MYHYSYNHASIRSPKRQTTTPTRTYTLGEAKCSSMRGDGVLLGCGSVSVSWRNLHNKVVPPSSPSQGPWAPSQDPPALLSDKLGGEAVASMYRGKDAEFVEDVLSVGDGGDQPNEVVFVIALKEESDDPKKRAGGAKYPSLRLAGRLGLEEGVRSGLKCFEFPYKYFLAPSVCRSSWSHGRIPFLLLG